MRTTKSPTGPLGAILWTTSIQYYIVQLVVAATWAKTNGYNWAYNTISDLGNTHCGPYGSRLVCSPHHSLMNGSFVLLGITMIGGAIFLQEQFSARLSSVGFGCMAIAGVGTLVVGLFPENTVRLLHTSGAALPFIFGNLGMLILGYSLRQLPLFLRGYTVISGAIGLTALALFVTHSYLGLGIGGIERLVSYPQSLWITVLGSYLLLQGTNAKQTTRTTNLIG